MEDVFSFTEIEEGGLLAAGKGGWTELIIKSGLGSQGEGQKGVVEIQKKGVGVSEWECKLDETSRVRGASPLGPSGHGQEFDRVRLYIVQISEKHS